MADGGVHDRDELARALGYDGMHTKAFANVLATLGGTGYVTYPNATSAQLSAKAFRF
jgi:hypothetical protein